MDFHSSVSLLEGNNGCTWTPRRFPEGLPNYKPSLPTTSKWDDAQVSPFKPCFFVLTSTPNMCPTPHVTSCLWAFGALSSRTQLGVTCGFTTLNTTHSTNPQNDFLSPSPSLYTPKKKTDPFFFPIGGGWSSWFPTLHSETYPPKKKKKKKALQLRCRLPIQLWIDVRCHEAQGLAEEVVGQALPAVVRVVQHPLEDDVGGSQGGQTRSSQRSSAPQIILISLDLRTSNMLFLLLGEGIKMAIKGNPLNDENSGPKNITVELLLFVGVACDVMFERVMFITFPHVCEASICTIYIWIDAKIIIQK